MYGSQLSQSVITIITIIIIIIIIRQLKYRTRNRSGLA